MTDKECIDFYLNTPASETSKILTIEDSNSWFRGKTLYARSVSEIKCNTCKFYISYPKWNCETCVDYNHYVKRIEDEK